MLCYVPMGSDRHPPSTPQQSCVALSCSGERCDNQWTVEHYACKSDIERVTLTTSTSHIIVPLFDLHSVTR